MKKIISIPLVITIMFLFVSCSSTNKETEEIEGATVDNSSENIVEEEEKEEENDISADVDITFPAMFFEGNDMSTFDTDAYIKENDFKKAVINEDGSVTVKMSKTKHNELLEEMETQIKTSFDELVESEETPYIKGIIHSNDYRDVTVDVIRSEYEGVFDVTPMQVYFSVVFYQLILGAEPYCEIMIRDVESKEIIKSFVYPEVMQ